MDSMKVARIYIVMKTKLVIGLNKLSLLTVFINLRCQFSVNNIELAIISTKQTLQLSILVSTFLGARSELKMNTIKWSRTVLCIVAHILIP